MRPTSAATTSPATKLRCFQLEHEGASVVIRCHSLSSLNDEAVRTDIEQIVALVGRYAAPTVTIDLQNVRFIGSTMVAGLYRLGQAVSSHGGQVRLRNVTDLHLDVLKATRLDRLWPVDPAQE